MISTLIAAGILAVTALGTYLWQRSAFRAQQAQPLKGFEVEFYRRRNRRRVQISGMLGLVAVGMGIGAWVTQPLVVGFLWLGILLLLLWIMLLAFADAWHSQMHFARLRVTNMAEHAALQKKMLQELDRKPERDPEY
jgi:hypothetical protein